MLIRTSISLLTLAFFAMSLANAQEPPKAILADEFGAISCEELLAKQDLFFSELASNPQDHGYVIFFLGGKNPKGFLKIATANLYLRRFDRERLKIVLAESKNRHTDGEFWSVPPGAQPPHFIEVRPVSQDFSKAFVFGEHTEDNVCPAFIPKLYADSIKDHPGSYGKIIVSGPGWRSRKQYADSEIERFENEFGLPRQRLRYHFVHRKGAVLTEAEYWFIP